MLLALSFLEEILALDLGAPPTETLPVHMMAQGRSESKSVSINVSNWEIFDAMRELEEEDELCVCRESPVLGAGIWRLGVCIPVFSHCDCWLLFFLSCFLSVRMRAKKGRTKCLLRNLKETKMSVAFSCYLQVFMR